MQLSFIHKTIQQPGGIPNCEYTIAARTRIRKRHNGPNRRGTLKSNLELDYPQILNLIMETVFMPSL